ncbi:MAG: DUF134 domain-containing protein [Candidatus Thermoplasmatota archaeon]|nr:DUF134 domain-containing protein [Candidatus Thermoplasmatota archaeon]
MPRPKRCRKICLDPNHKIFKPQGTPLSELSIIEMELDELEALRLSDLEGFSQGQSAEKMDVSQPTFNRILSSARHKSAKSLIDGAALKIARNVPHTIDPDARKDHGRNRSRRGKETGDRA